MNRATGTVVRILVFLAFVSGSLWTSSVVASEQDGSAVLTFAERLSCSERIEDVYWAHRIWPQSNSGPRPARSAVVSREDLASGIDRSLLLQAALEAQWGATLGPLEIQAELDRMAASSRDPDLLRVVFAALDHDPYLVAECFVRPRLVERTARRLYLRDRELHGALRSRAESALLDAGSTDDLVDAGAVVSKVRWSLVDGTDHGEPDLEREDHVVTLTPAEWRDLQARLARVFDGPTDRSGSRGHPDPVADRRSLIDRGFSPLLEEDHAFIAVDVVDAGDAGVTVTVASWPKTSFDDWIEARILDLDPADPAAGAYVLPRVSPKSLCVDDTWESMADNGASTPRSNFVSVWTGTELIIWGGDLWGTETNTGARYDLASDSWTATTTTGAPSARNSHRAVWTGTEMIIWGGANYPSWYDTGGRYNPSTNGWTATSTTGAPSARGHHAAVWSGTELIVWGGVDTNSHLSTGGRYNPASNTWSATSVTGAPSPRRGHTGVWSGSAMIIWGGNLGAPAHNDGARYSPATDSWVATSLTEVPDARWDHTAVWTGTEMIVWGGYGSSWLDTGGRYDPVSDSWTATSTAGAPSPRYYHSAVWTGTEMIIWGGHVMTTYENTGGRYDPSGEVWVSTSTTGAPIPRSAHAAAWPGTTPKMIVTLGGDNSGPLQSGGLYCASGFIPYDFGDAPDPSYPTLLASDGARHVLGGGLFLGSLVDGEPDGQPTAGADGDDLDGSDDEDGVVFTSLLQVGFDATIDVTASAAGLLNAWLDLNADGDWNDPGEQIVTDTALVAGVNNLVVPIPLDAAVGSTYVRFRLDSAGGLAPTGLAADGEVEDYAVTIEPSAEVSVSVADSPDPAVEGGELRYFVDIANNGALDATGVALTDTLPAEAVFSSVTPGAPTCSHAAGVVSCDLGTLAGGAATQVVITVDLPYGTVGTLTSTAVVALDQSDPVPANNTAVEATQVVADADHIFTDGFESGLSDRWSDTVP